MIHWLKKIWHPLRIKKPADGYNLWAAAYDSQPDNLILRLDEELFNSFIKQTTVAGKAVADIGCGTGRHWQKIFSLSPQRLAGFDVSEGMLHQLHAKWPEAETFLLTGDQFPGNLNGQFDLVISTLTIAHIPGLENKMIEWNRLLRPGGEVIITDYHPDALQRNARRTFRHNGKTIALESFVYPISQVRSLAGQLGWSELRFAERKIDEAVKPFYEKQNALHLYQKFYGMPLIYGIHLKKSNDTP